MLLNFDFKKKKKNSVYDIIKQVSKNSMNGFQLRDMFPIKNNNDNNLNKLYVKVKLQYSQ